MRRVIALALGFLAILVWLGPVQEVRANRIYAAQVFDGVVDYDKVLVSRRWHRFGWAVMPYSGKLDCTYAVVHLSATAPAAPPEPDLTIQLPQNAFVFPGAWQPTPGPTMHDPEFGLWSRCRDLIGQDVFADMETALAEPGGWWRADLSNIEATYFVYSAAHSIAYRLRYGD
jgi:hypothetical protein